MSAKSMCLAAAAALSLVAAGCGSDDESTSEPASTAAAPPAATTAAAPAALAGTYERRLTRSDIERTAKHPRRVRPQPGDPGAGGDAHGDRRRRHEVHRPRIRPAVRDRAEHHRDRRPALGRGLHQPGGGQLLRPPDPAERVVRLERRGRRPDAEGRARPLRRPRLESHGRVGAQLDESCRAGPSRSGDSVSPAHDSPCAPDSAGCSRSPRWGSRRAETTRTRRPRPPPRRSRRCSRSRRATPPRASR